MCNDFGKTHETNFKDKFHATKDGTKFNFRILNYDEYFFLVGQEMLKIFPG